MVGGGIGLYEVRVPGSAGSVEGPWAWAAVLVIR